jgi:hypothetical protein
MACIQKATQLLLCHASLPSMRRFGASIVRIHFTVATFLPVGILLLQELEHAREMVSTICNKDLVVRIFDNALSQGAIAKIEDDRIELSWLFILFRRESEGHNSATYDARQLFLA